MARQDSSQSASNPRGERLQKVLAAAGLGSRRACEELILEGRVDVDRETVTTLGVRVDAASQKIRVDGQTLKVRRKIYFAVNKPQGVVCTNSDPEGRTRVVDLVNTDERLFTVGRLDKSSEGLILVTNDGELANRLAHPRHGVQKTYRVEVAGTPSREDMDQLCEGVHLAEGFAKVDSLKVRKKTRKGTEMEIVLSEGRNREIRRMLARVGNKVLRLKRIALGPLQLGDIPNGGYRKLSPGELESLVAASEKGRRKAGARSSRGGNAARKKSAASARHTSKPAAGRPGPGRPGPGRPGAGRPGRPGAAGKPGGKPASTRQRPPKQQQPGAPGGAIIGGDEAPPQSDSKPKSKNTGGKKSTGNRKNSTSSRKKPAPRNKSRHKPR